MDYLLQGGDYYDYYSRFLPTERGPISPPSLRHLFHRERQDVRPRAYVFLGWIPDEYETVSAHWRRLGATSVEDPRAAASFRPLRSAALAYRFDEMGVPWGVITGRGPLPAGDVEFDLSSEVWFDCLSADLELAVVLASVGAEDLDRDDPPIGSVHDWNSSEAFGSGPMLAARLRAVEVD